jgi:hypothetical protein
MGRSEVSAVRARWAGAVLGMMATGVFCLYVFRGCSSADPGGSKAPPAAAVDVPPRIEVPQFGRPEEAKRYFDAMTDGDARSLQLIEQALAAAKAAANPDQSAIAQLEQERTLRQARLKAFQGARATLETSAPHTE